MKSQGGEEAAYQEKKVLQWGERRRREQGAGDPWIGTVMGV
jgi:hypothetical protein